MAERVGFWRFPTDAPANEFVYESTELILDEEKYPHSTFRCARRGTLRCTG